MSMSPAAVAEDHVHDIPLADEDEASSSLETTGKVVRPAHALPRDQMEEDQEEKARLISQVLELQNTLDDLSSRVDKVKEESLKLRSENQVLGQYIQNLMGASSVFQSTAPKSASQNGHQTNGSGGGGNSGFDFLSGFFW